MTAFLLQRIRSFGTRACLVSAGETVTYESFGERIDFWCAELDRWGVRRGDIVAVCGDYVPDVCALLLALAFAGAIVVPIASAGVKRDEFLGTAEVGLVVTFDGAGRPQVERCATLADAHPLIERLRNDGAAGLILFSSGSTGRSKASLLDFDRLVAKLEKATGRAYVTLVFLMLDHIGGINTLLNVLAQGGTIVTPASRSPDAVCDAIARHRVELLPTSPTFINMMLISDAGARYDLSSLKLITYGTEPMPETTLAALHDALPDVKLKQTYGLSELGILPTQSKDSGSLWMKLGTNGFEHKIVDGVLWVRSETAMLGYLNAPTPFDDDGWFNTQDVVETEGEYVRVLGRRSEIINVGGEKVYPSEVESTLLAAGNVRDVTVAGRPNPVTGHVVVARVSPIEPEAPAALVARLRDFCTNRLERFKVPVHIEIDEGAHHNDRFKKARVSRPTEQPK
ncbi:ANL family adenylate-forming protein [Paraburkholderia tuberum]|uniref:Acyl-CoA synthetase (AMP-forming)/AMP-acid ligase II n=1 Tax=Paraburkholderia tuberum TaxID=157910 RepID=A0A1H1KK93_9BURK|nr:fatty acid--CoA ligase family protein [Paraburkholderia tuberum]SDR62507.1 Acyl-CoA synthetase (AMP-forming)/AMP-acid ligase II [Paraburkholderia tuberum]